ncbi:peptidoglycan editing factor PgeF [Aurantiacibacter sp. MUD11]|uniref:peptidoglycan editing factor PgeF n=1 Tax=Aurantiacibacter sp. MUD11 TaxID=3003265 RepID=UPI0022AAF441|nr:peptidoglycan editing factor PgeF [Aurantiacibacter sp. MUD11]WAT17279.1 peptidoglycan editing factor PgeF [Aurantiacibacter sp. MUD11]
MADAGEVVRAANIAVPHGFLDAAQSDARQLSLAIGEAEPVFVEQVHSATAICVDRPFKDAARPQVDAMATATPGLALAVVTADCAPVLLADSQAGVIGAAHAGWRGAQGGVIADVVERMEELGAARANIAAAIGPTIAKASYEVGADMRAAFDPQDFDLFEATGPDKWHFDLEAYVVRQLAAAGIESVCPLGLDTYADKPRFHSYRRATHLGEPTTGRQISLIALPG